MIAASVESERTGDTYLAQWHDCDTRSSAPTLTEKIGTISGSALRRGGLVAFGVRGPMNGVAARSSG